MRAGIENWLLRHWYGSQQPPWYLRVLKPVYAAAYRRIQNKKRVGACQHRSALPLVVVGNITAGGSGKTPLVMHLCQLALDMNFKPGIASTGYGRQSEETIVVQADGDTRICGDEPVLMSLRTGVPVVVAAKRLDAVKRLGRMNLDLIFSDDGLQQADLDRDLEFCVVDGERGLGNGHLIPAGPLREPAARLRQVDHVVSNGEWADKPDDVPVSVMRLRANEVRSIDDTCVYPLVEFRHKYTGNIIHAIAGIGHPNRFFKMLKFLGFTVISQGFPDHHAFTRKDFDSITAGATIIMTEKDAVKCRSLGLENAWYIPVETHLPDVLEQVFTAQLTKLIKDRK